MKKMWLAALAVMLVLVVAACSGGGDKPGNSAGNGGTAGGTQTGNQGGSQGGDVKKPVTIKFLNDSHASWPHNDDWIIWDLYAEATGVTLDVQVPAGPLEDTLSLAMASGSLPDMMFVTEEKVAHNYGLEGALANVLDYLDVMPNFKAWMDKYPMSVMNATAADGNIYMLPIQGIGDTNRSHWLYREDVFRKHSMQPPNDWDELYTVLKELKRLYPDSYPLSFRNGFSRILNFAPAFDTLDDVYYNFEQQEWRYGPIEDNYKTMVSYLRTFYDEGLIPPDFLSMDVKQYESLMSTDRSFVAVDSIGRIDFFNNAMRSENPEYNMAFMPTPAGWAGGPRKNAHTHFYSKGFMVSSTSDKIEEVFKYMDFFYSEEGRELGSWGKEGVTFEVAGGEKKFIEDYADVSDLRKKTGLSSYGVFAWFDYDSHISLASDDLKKAYAEAPKYDSEEQPRPAFTKDEAEVLATVGAAVSKRRDEDIARFILGTKNIDEWDSYVNVIKELGVDQIVDIYKAANDRR